MATGRTLNKYRRVYVDGFDLSGFSRTIGPLDLMHAEVDLTADMGDTVKGYLKGHTQVNVGVLNTVFDNTATTGIHAVLQSSGVARTVLVAQGIRAAPAAGDPAFGGVFLQSGYQEVDAAGAATLTIPFAGWAEDAASLLFASPWGVLLHALGAETAVNTATGNDNPTGGATTNGGYFIYQVTAGNGTATLSVDDSADNISFLALSGATSGSINTAVRSAAIVAIGTAATVRRFLRFQIAFGTATTVTFTSAFMRG